MTDLAGSGWHLDKRVPLALILTIFIQTGAAFAWAATLAARVTAIERTLALAEDRGDRITRLEANQEHIARTLRRIESKLDRLGGQ